MTATILAILIACATPPAVGEATTAEGICLEQAAAACWCGDPSCIPEDEAADVCGNLDQGAVTLLLAMAEDWACFAQHYVETCELSATLECPAS